MKSLWLHPLLSLPSTSLPGLLIRFLLLSASLLTLAFTLMLLDDLTRFQFSTFVVRLVAESEFARWWRQKKERAWTDGLPRKEQPILGYRAFVGGRPYLTSLSQQYRWQPGTNTATHRGYSPAGHGVARKGCSCGFWAYHSIQEAIDYQEGAIVGAIIGWGRVTIADWGFRCEHARIVALSYDDYTTMGVMKTAKKYGVPLMERSQIERYAEEFGKVYRPVPKLLPSSVCLYCGVKVGDYHVRGCPSVPSSLLTVSPTGRVEWTPSNAASPIVFGAYPTSTAPMVDLWLKTNPLWVARTCVNEHTYALPPGYEWGAPACPHCKGAWK